MHRPCTRPRRRAPRTAAAVALTVLLGLPLGACSGDDGDPAADGPGGGASGATEGPPPLETVAKVGTVTGQLSGARRARLVTHVSDVVDGWIDGAFLGDYPRSDFAEAFPGFSAGAADDARTDGALMSNKPLGADLTEVVALQRRLTIDTLAVKGRAVAVTARVVLTMRLSGEVNRQEKVAGSLLMTYREGGWQVFGYDVTRGRAR